MTRAPSALPISTAVRPTPPAAPSTSSVSPTSSRPCQPRRPAPAARPPGHRPRPPPPAPPPAAGGGGARDGGGGDAPRLVGRRAVGHGKRRGPVARRQLGDPAGPRGRPHRRPPVAF